MLVALGYSPDTCRALRLAKRFRGVFRSKYGSGGITWKDKRQEDRGLNFNPYVGPQDARAIMAGFRDRLLNHQPPLSDPYLNLAQLLAWVYIRDPDAVRDYSNANPQRLDAAGIYITIVQMREQRHLPCDEELIACGAILHELREGRLVAYGLENGTGALKEIPTLQWVDMETYFAPDCAKPTDFSRRGATEWRELKFKREQVLALWPDQSAKAEDAVTCRPPTRTAEATKARQHNQALRLQCLEAFLKDIDQKLQEGGGYNWNRNSMPVTKADFCKVAKRKYPQLKTFADRTIVNDLGQFKASFWRGTKSKKNNILEQFFPRPKLT